MNALWEKPGERVVRAVRNPATNVRDLRSVLAQVDGKMIRPPPERPLEGVITIHSELSPMAANEYEPGR